jgi:hypothetical protein
MLILAPSAPNGRTAMPVSAQAAAKAGVCSPSRSQTKLASLGGTAQPSASSASRTRVRSFTVSSTRSRSSASAAREAIAAAWASRLTVNGSMVARAAAATGSCAIMNPVRSPARP